MPTASDFPSIRSVALELKPTPHNPLGAKGVGEKTAITLLQQFETLDGTQVEEIVHHGRFTPPTEKQNVEPPTGAQAATPTPP